MFNGFWTTPNYRFTHNVLLCFTALIYLFIFIEFLCKHALCCISRLFIILCMSAVCLRRPVKKTLASFPFICTVVFHLNRQLFSKPFSKPNYFLTAPKHIPHHDWYLKLCILLRGGFLTLPSLNKSSNPQHPCTCHHDLTNWHVYVILYIEWYTGYHYWKQTLGSCQLIPSSIKCDFPLIIWQMR